jgi:hypothetical protein
VIVKLNRDNFLSAHMVSCLLGCLYLLASLYFPVLSVVVLILATMGIVLMFLKEPADAFIGTLRLVLLFFFPYIGFKFKVFLFFRSIFRTLSDGTYTHDKWEGSLPTSEQRFVLIPFILIGLLFTPAHVINCLYWTASESDDISVKDIPQYVMGWSELSDNE